LLADYDSGSVTQAGDARRWGRRTLIRHAEVVAYYEAKGLTPQLPCPNLSRTLVRTLAVGLGTLAVSYLVGKLVL
jgi:hypothetical protein